MQKIGYSGILVPQSFSDILDDSCSDDESPFQTGIRKASICSNDEDDFFDQGDDGFTSQNSSRKSSICALENMHIQLVSARLDSQPPSVQHATSSGYNSQQSFDYNNESRETDVTQYSELDYTSSDDDDVVEFIRNSQDYNPNDEESGSEDEAAHPQLKIIPPQKLPIPKFSEKDLNETLGCYQFDDFKGHRKCDIPLYDEQDDDCEGLEQGVSRTVVELFAHCNNTHDLVRRKRIIGLISFPQALAYCNEFAHELKIHTPLHHRNIAHCYGCNYSLENDTLTLSLFVEYAGCQLNDHMINLKKQRADEATCTNQLINFTLQLCSALTYLKEQSVVHRDIKPANIGVKEGNLKLFDFEDAVNLAQDSADKPAGTPYFSAPEMTSSEFEETDFYKCDWYSAGLTLAFAGYQANLLDRPTRMADGENSKMLCSITPYNSNTTNPKTLSLINVLKGMTHSIPTLRMPPKQAIKILSA